jgi:hypothetical protein
VPTFELDAGRAEEVPVMPDSPASEPTLTYTVTEDLEGFSPLTYEITVPGSMTVLDISTLRVARDGGPTEGDQQYRAELFSLVGSVTVAGGQIEAALKRLLLVLRGADTVFALADLEWGRLHTQLADLCDGSDERRAKLQSLLSDAERMRLRDRRNTVVHGAWWIFSGCGVRVSRWPRRKDDSIELWTLADLQSLADACWDFAEQIDLLLAPSDWAQAWLRA